MILTYWGYKEALISSFTLPYIQSLHKVNPQMDLFLFTLNKEEQILKNNEIEKANRELSEFNTKLLAFNYRKFGFIALFKMFFLIIRLLRIIRKERITHLHCFCTPAGGIGYLLKFFSRVTLVLDSYEPHAESMVESGGWKSNSLAFRILFF